jgi:ABC-type phosphate/phosphonate transport system substrate-binding protein
VATPCYRAEGCEGAWHRSALVVRRDDPAETLADLAGRRAAMNARDSNTGMNLLRAAVAPLARDGRFFGSVVETGAHARSVLAVIAGRADIAAVDAVTLALLRDRYPGIDRRLRVLGWTAQSPGLPLITAQPALVEPLRRALGAVMADPALAPVRAALRLEGIALVDRSAYAAVPALEQAARDAGYPELA